MLFLIKLPGLVFVSPVHPQHHPTSAGDRDGYRCLKNGPCLWQKLECGMPEPYIAQNLKRPRIHAKRISLNSSFQPLSFTSVYLWFKVPYNRKGKRSRHLCRTLRIKPRRVPQNKLPFRGQTWAMTIEFRWHLIIHKDFLPSHLFSAQRVEVEPGGGAQGCLAAASLHQPLAGSEG